MFTYCRILVLHVTFHKIFNCNKQWFALVDEIIVVFYMFSPIETLFLAM